MSVGDAARLLVAVISGRSVPVPDFIRLLLLSARKVTQSRVVVMDECRKAGATGGMSSYANARNVSSGSIICRGVTVEESDASEVKIFKGFGRYWCCGLSPWESGEVNLTYVGASYIVSVEESSGHHIKLFGILYYPLSAHKTLMIGYLLLDLTW